MKNLLLIIFIITGLAACKSSPEMDQQRNIQLLPDAGSYTNNVFSDTTSIAKAEVIPEKVSEKPYTKTIVRTIVIERPAPQSGNVRQATKRDDGVPEAATSEPVATAPVTSVPTAQSPDVDSSSTTGTTDATVSSNEKEVKKKTGMNKATQGAIIGGVAGAVGGAVISKKKGLGAVVGGIAGAAGGYIIGKTMDKKDNKFMID